jgi:CDP-diacylglycerol--serine O-phosphatidyltransferase
MSAAAMRLARFNIQTGGSADKRYFVGMPSPPAAGVAAATVFAWPFPLTAPVDLRLLFSEPAPWQALAAVAVMLVPGALMVSTIRFRSFKTINFGWGRSYLPLLLFTLLVASIFASPRFTLLVLAYGYLASAFIGLAWSRVRGRRAAQSAGERR